MDSDHLTPTKEEQMVLKEVLKALHNIRHGYIQLVVQDSRVVQIDKMEKVRLPGIAPARLGQM